MKETINSGTVNGYLLTNFKEYNNKTKKAVFDYLKGLELSQEEITSFGKYWASCIKLRGKK